MNGEKKRARLDQRRAPIHEALENFRQMRVVPFDVPGHKRGRGNPELTAFLGQQCVGVDVNSMKPLDNLCHPVSVIREAEELAADAFGAAHAFLMVGGTTSSVQSMVLTACKRGDEIILPRNVHRSVLNALVLCGAVPVYVNPEVDQRLGISLGMKREQVAKAIAEHPNAVAVLVNNPTYYGICSDLRAIVRMAHDAGMLCLADEAHGTHFYFGGGLPVSAMAAGADMASVSMHKSGGSLTQSSLLLTGPNVHAGYVRQIINLTQTTSGSYLLNGQDVSQLSLSKLAEIRNASFGFVMQHFALIEEDNALQNVATPLLFAKARRSQMDARAMEQLRNVGMEQMANKRIATLSGGEKQRVAIARAMVNNPEIILADEPTGALDRANTEKIVQLFQQLNEKGKTIIIVTHDDFVAQSCRRIVTIADGVIKST